jgi:hypothetical protein
MKRARQGPNQKAKLCSRLRGIALKFTSRAMLKGKAVAAYLAIFLSA